MKAILDSPFNSIAPRIASHRSAQGAIYADMIRHTGVNLDVNWGGMLSNHNDYDVMYVYHGNDWGGGLNLFGGIQGADGTTVRNFSKFKGQVYSLAVDFPPYHEMIESKIKTAHEKNNPPRPEWLEVDLENLKRMYETATTLKVIEKTDKLVIGDSHSICMYRPGWMVNSVPFKTLNGALNEGFSSFVEGFSTYEELSELEVYFGNIDIRHHLCRISNDHEKNTRELVNRYFSALEKIPVDRVSVYEPLPIENISRVLPKTGYYKGKPYSGTWEERNNCRILFRDMLKEKCSNSKVTFKKWVDKLQNQFGELSFDVMEKPRSVHLSREFYPYWQGEIFKKENKNKPIVKKKEKIIIEDENNLERFFE
jgi:hypothetical protein